MIYIRRKSQITALQYTGLNINTVREFIPKKYNLGSGDIITFNNGLLNIYLPNSTLHIYEGDWLVCEGDYLSCFTDIEFRSEYVSIESERLIPLDTLKNMLQEAFKH